MLDSLDGLIGISGFKGSGKDTSADYLVEEYSYTSISLAYVLKKCVMQIYGFPEEHLFGPSSLREIPDERYIFSGLDPFDGSQLTEVGYSTNRWWRRDSDGELFPRFLTPRLALTTIGTNACRRMYDDTWLHATMNHIRSTGNPIHVVPDVRFMNELEGIQKAGGVVIRLLRGKLETTHASEKELSNCLDKFDFVIDNQGSKDELYAYLDKVLKKVNQP